MDVPGQSLRRLTCAALLAALAAVTHGCGEPTSPDDAFAQGRRWLEDPALRRRVLEDSLVAWDNGYAELRLDNYTEQAWGARPAWSPQVAVATGSVAPAAFRPAVAGGFEDEAGLEALGEAAFSRYPTQIVPELRAALVDPAACGLERGPDGEVLGVVWVALPDGPQPALTCAACHTSRVEPDAAPVPGRANPRFDLGAVLAGRCGAPSAWGPGRVDVTADGVDNPTAVPDLRPVRWQHHLQRAATVKNGRLALAARTETLIITSLSGSVRPPREVALGLSWYLWRLADDLPAPAPDREAEALLSTHCGRCHGGEGLAGPAVPRSEAGTDAAILDSPARGTGFARVPALRGLSDRGLLFSGGAARDLEAWWSGRDAVPGHFDPSGLSEASRARLRGYLESL